MSGVSHRFGMSVRTLLSLLVLCICIYPITSSAQTAGDYHPFLSDRFNIGVGIFFPRKNFNLRVDGRNPEEEIDFDEVLRLDDDEVVPSLAFRWRLGKQKKWSLWGQYWRVSDSAGTVLTEDVEWEDVIFKEGSFVKGGVRQEIARIFVGREFFTQQPNHEFGLGLGAALVNLEAFIEGEILTEAGDPEYFRDKVTADAPLPNIGAWYSYSWSPKWIVHARLDYLNANINDYDGELWTGQVGIHWQTFKNIGFGLYYNAFSLSLDVEKKNWRGRVESKQHGPWLAVTASW